MVAREAFGLAMASVPRLLLEGAMRETYVSCGVQPLTCAHLEAQRDRYVERRPSRHL